MNRFFGGNKDQDEESKLKEKGLIGEGPLPINPDDSIFNQVYDHVLPPFIAYRFFPTSKFVIVISIGR